MKQLLNIALLLLTALAASAHIPRSTLELTPVAHQFDRDLMSILEAMK